MEISISNYLLEIISYLSCKLTYSWLHYTGRKKLLTLHKRRKQKFINLIELIIKKSFHSIPNGFMHRTVTRRSSAVSGPEEDGRKVGSYDTTGNRIYSRKEIYVHDSLILL